MRIVPENIIIQQCDEFNNNVDVLPMVVIGNGSQNVPSPMILDNQPVATTGIINTPYYIDNNNVFVQPHSSHSNNEFKFGDPIDNHVSNNNNSIPTVRSNSFIPSAVALIVPSYIPTGGTPTATALLEASPTVASYVVGIPTNRNIQSSSSNTVATGANNAKDGCCAIFCTRYCATSQV